MMSTIFVAVIVGGMIGWTLIGALLLFIPWKRTKPRGFIPHLAWRWGLLRFRHYPGPTQAPLFRVECMGHPFRRKVDADMIGDTRPSWHLHRYLQGSANLFEENRLLKFSNRGTLGITAVLGTVVYTSNQNQRTVIVPFGAGGDLYVTGNKPSTTYLRTITRNMVGLAGTYSAYSADRQFQELLSLVQIRAPIMACATA